MPLAYFLQLFVTKQLYGGLGHNIFNPAMLAYALLLISFPLEMSTWHPPENLVNQNMHLHEIIQHIFNLSPMQEIGTTGNVNFIGNIDGYTLATPLDLIRNNQGLTLQELTTVYPQLNLFSEGISWTLLNFAWALGGIFLLYKRIISWHAPVAMLGALMIWSILFMQGNGSESNGSPIFHLLSGGTMMGAFFIVTDPVTAATSNKGRLITGFIVGSLVYIIRAFGGYPDGVAFAILLVNILTPTIDLYTLPKPLGPVAEK